MMKPCRRIQAISLTLAGMLSLPARVKVIPVCILALPMVLMGLHLEAQPRDAELRFHVGTGPSTTPLSNFPPGPPTGTISENGAGLSNRSIR